MDFKGKIILITGGDRGIGFSTAKLYAGHGGTVVIGDLNSGKMGVLTKRSGFETIYESVLDIADEENVQALVRLIVEKFGHIDILVNNAGICRNALPFEDVPLKNWHQMFSVNTFGAVNCVKAVIPHMKAQKSGSIIMSSSVAAEVGGIRTEASYSASKAANICIMMSLAKYLGPYNITVNGIAPGVVDTEMTNSLEPANINTIPLGRIATPEDVGNTILFLTSDEANYLTGVMVDVNGGMYMR